jgi:predicted RNA binding protein YcfA (HicA-like mRNA interferase family)
LPRLRRLSGHDVVRILGTFGFATESQRGSHVKLRRVLPDGTRQTLQVPLHRQLDSGLTRGIFRQASRYIAEDELRSHFFTD